MHHLAKLILLELAIVLLTQTTLTAGIYSPLEQTNPLPAKWRGFLPDQRQLRLIAVDPATLKNNLNVVSTLRERYLDSVLKWEGRAKSSDEIAELSSSYLRLGQYEKAIQYLRVERRRHTADFRIVSHLATAFQLSGDLQNAAELLKEAIPLATEKQKLFEQYQLKLVQSRLKETDKKFDSVDQLFPDAQRPENAIEITQQLALWFPADGRLLWQLAILAHDANDLRTAANILDGCVSEFGMANESLRKMRVKYRAEVDALNANDQHQATVSSIKFLSSRPLGSTFDASKLQAIKDDRPNILPWAALLETTIGKGFKPDYHTHINALDGKPVSLLGFPTSSGDDADGQIFLMTEYPIGCWFCETPEPVSIVRIELGKAVEHDKLARQLVKIVGTLSLNRKDPEKFLVTIKQAKIVGEN